MTRSTYRRISVLFALAACIACFAQAARAHCDTTRGPVVADARNALDRGDVTPVLKWVQPAAEPEIRAAFDHAVRVRALGEEARRLADGWFFETLVRVHRAGEGAAYTGLRDEAPEAIVQAVDEALAGGEVEPVVEEVTAAVAAGLRERFQRALVARREAEASVAQGREYVASYVALTHYVERLHASASAGAEHASGEAGGAGDTAPPHGHD